MNHLNTLAYERGESAFFLGFDETENPYDRMDNNHYNWKQGYLDAMSEALDKYQAEIGYEQRDELYGHDSYIRGGWGGYD